MLVSTRLCEVTRLGSRLYLGRRPCCFSQFDFEDYAVRDRLILLYRLHDIVLKDITTRTSKTFRLRTICTAKRLTQRQFITLTLDGLDCSISHILYASTTAIHTMHTSNLSQGRRAILKLVRLIAEKILDRLNQSCPEPSLGGDRQHGEAKDAVPSR